MSRSVLETVQEYVERLSPKVSCVSRTKSFLEYSVNKQKVFFWLDSKKPVCTCRHGSLWGVRKENELCRHVKTVREAIRRRRKMWW